jgi:predicted house-cleaning noncanonical NTP pyrophosphatase (MazG superfamily)
LQPKDISIDLIGEKAFGLSCIPKRWTLPFIVLSKEFVSNKNLIDLLKNEIYEALQQINLNNPDENIILRSSGCIEGLSERGQLYSSPCTIETLIEELNNLVDTFLQDQQINPDCLHIIVQKHIFLYSEKGHLSNERRLHKDKRDWSYEIERKSENLFYPLGLRNWREEVMPENFENNCLQCNLEQKLKPTLSIVSAWATKKTLRLHFEWVWDGKCLYIVQADMENENIGSNPTLITSTSTKDYTHKLQCLIPVNDELAKKFPKINNVLIYRGLNLPIAPLYILNDQKIIQDLAKGVISDLLKRDIEVLIQSPLIIRIDIGSEDKSIRQMLSRQEHRDLESALKWLQKQVNNILSDKNTKKLELAFIFHNFIPSVSSAFAYCKPGTRKVHIEALWGLPEGLYYYSHDKYIVDTKSYDCDNIKSFEKFSIEGKPLFKPFFITADNDGNWKTKRIAPPYDWIASIREEDWIKQIALYSRKITEEVGKSLSIMWFVDVPNTICSSQIFPWHHEPFDLHDNPRSKITRKKTPFDQILIIKTLSDLESLQRETEKDNTKIKKIHIQPIDEKLLRDKNVLQRIGKLSKDIGAIILLEGSLLTHAYYQLQQTGAIVETINNYENFEQKQEFNKLVRDKIPENIESNGEIVQLAQLEKTSMIRALKDKLIEESFEVLDAEDEKSILAELADIYEVIDGFLYHMDIDKQTLLHKQKEKAQKVGSFLEGKVLLETKNPMPTQSQGKQLSLFNHDELKETTISYEKLAKKEIYKYRDTRKLTKNINDNILRFKIPFTQDSWRINTRNIILDEQNKIEIDISGERLNAEYKIEINIYSQKEHETPKFNLDE